MFSFTRQERIVLSLLALIMLTGASLNYAFKKYPRLQDIVNLIDSDRLYPKQDVNTATLNGLVRIPYIGEYTARNIINYREKNGLFKSVEQIKCVKGIREKNYEKFAPFLEIKKR